MNVPDELRYSNDHEWIRTVDDRVRVGITDYAQGVLGVVGDTHPHPVVHRADPLVVVRVPQFVGHVHRCGRYPTGLGAAWGAGGRRLRGGDSAEELPEADGVLL